MKLRIFYTVSLLLSASIVTAAPKKLSKPFNTISRIKSPVELLSHFLPKRYTASLSLSGSIADEIKAILDTLEMDTPQFSEIYSRKKGYRLIITNKEYTSQTRDLISGILNPIELTGIVLNSILQYRNPDVLLHMQKETTVTVKEDSSRMVLEIKPAGTQFNYKYKDAGAYINESWLTMLSISVDPATMLAHELLFVKHSRTLSSDQINKSIPQKKMYKYVFHYKKFQSSFVPIQLDLYRDTFLILTLSAVYRRIDRFLVFDKREITYTFRKKTESTLIINYQNYTFDISPAEMKETESSGKYAAKLNKAAAFARKATEALNKGNTQTAFGLLETIIEKCPGTPHAVEAQKLLSSLPNGL